MKNKNIIAEDSQIIDQDHIDSLIPSENNFIMNRNENMKSDKVNINCPIIINPITEATKINDINASRKHLYDLMQIGSEAATNLYQTLNQNTLPVGYADLARLLDSVRQCATALAGLHSKNLTGEPDNHQHPTKVVNNNLTLTSEDVQKLLKESKKPRKEEDE